MLSALTQTQPTCSKTAHHEKQEWNAAYVTERLHLKLPTVHPVQEAADKETGKRSAFSSCLWAPAPRLPRVLPAWAPCGAAALAAECREGERAAPASAAIQKAPMYMRFLKWKIYGSLINLSGFFIICWYKNLSSSHKHPDALIF